MAATAWESNAQLIEACAILGYLKSTDLVIDPTYGKGTWWKRWRPDVLVEHDLRVDGVDFRHLPHPPHHFDAAVFDPPYEAKGGRKTSGIGEIDDRYGLGDPPSTPAALQELINAGLSELDRVVKPGGIVLAKCMDYVSSKKLWPGVIYTASWATQQCGMTLVDRSIHVRTINRLQPARSRRDGQPVHQQHYVANYSVLLVLQTSRGPR
jgi:hypothetical protein